MITLISTILGVMTAVLPNIVKLFEKRVEYKYEIELARLRIEAATRGLEIQSSIANAQAAVEEGKSLRDHDLALVYPGILETLRASVRPVLTYFFFFLFCGIKITAASLMFADGYNAIDVLNAVWDVYTVAIFGAIIGFWFGSRSMTNLTSMYMKDSSYFVVGKKKQ